MLHLLFISQFVFYFSFIIQTGKGVALVDDDFYSEKIRDKAESSVARKKLEIPVQNEIFDNFGNQEWFESKEFVFRPDREVVEETEFADSSETTPEEATLTTITIKSADTVVPLEPQASEPLAETNVVKPDAANSDRPALPEKPDAVAAGPDPSSLRVDIPNPGVNLRDSDAKEIISLIMSNPLIKAKFDSALGSPGVAQGDWNGGCLAKDTKFPTISLKLNSNNTSAQPNAESKAQEIRINKFYGVKRDRFYIRNTGNGMISIKFEPEAPTTEATMRGESWQDEYILAQGDLYWSLDNNHGAQHAIEDQPYTLELQLVHYAKKYPSLEKAAEKPGGILIASILFEAFGKHNPALEPIANAAVAVGFANTKWRQVHGPLDLKMLFPVDMSYYSYTGAYIGEPCVQSATYYVFRQPMIVSYIQLQKFREVRDHNSKRCSGIFMPLSAATDSMANERKVTSSGNAQSFLIVVPQDSLSTGMELHNSKGLILVTILMMRYIVFKLQ